MLLLLVLSTSAGAPGAGRPVPAASRKEDLPLARRLAMLRIGDPRAQVERLLGRPAEERELGGVANGAFATLLAYPNPAAPPELSPDLRWSFVYLDREGRVLMIQERGWGC